MLHSAMSVVLNLMERCAVFMLFLQTRGGSTVPAEAVPPATGTRRGEGAERAPAGRCCLPL